MRLSEALTEDLVVCNLKTRSKRRALSTIVHALVKSGKAASESELLEAVFGREKLQSTGIGRGIAVPHGIVKGVNSLSCAMGISRQGIKYGAIDGQPVHVIVMFVSEKTRDVQYLSLLASVCRIFESEALRKSIIRANTPKEVLELIREEEARECYFLRNLPV